MFKTVKMQGFEIKENLEVELYKIGLDKEVVEAFYENFHDGKKKIIKTNTLKKFIYTLSKDIVYVGDLYSLKFDDSFILSKSKINKKNLLVVIKMWGRTIIETLNKFDDKKELEVWLELLDIEKINEEDIKRIKLTDENGEVSNNKIYDILPNLLIEKLVSEKRVNLEKKVKFYSAGDRKAISSLLEVGKRKNEFSLAINFAVQTTPHSRKPIVIYDTRITRWIKTPFKGKIIKKSNTKVYIKIDKDSVYPLELGFEEGKVVWDKLSLDILSKVYLGIEIPDAYEYYINPEKYFDRDENPMYLNHRLEMGRTAVKAGLPMVDKLDIYFEIFKILKGKYINEIDEFENMNTKKPPTFKEKIKVGEDTKEFRKDLFTAIEKNELNLDIYYEYENETVKVVEKFIKRDFGIEGDIISDKYKVNIKFLKAPEILRELDTELNEIDRHEKRIREIESKIEIKDGVTASLVLLPYEDESGNKYFKNKTDPKYAIRAGLARRGCLTQFLTPEITKNMENRVKTALLDLYRQLGFFSRCEAEKKNVDLNYNMPVTALHVINFKKIPYGNTDRALVSLTMNPKENKIKVECPALWTGEKLYWEACLAFQEVASREGYKKFNKTRVNGDIKNKIYELYNNRDEKHLLLIESNGITRMGWNFIADSKLSKQERISKYRVEKLNFSTGSMDTGIDTNKDSELRIIRIRMNEEVPSYLTPRKEDGKCSSRSSVYQYNDVFYGIGKKPNDKFYNNTFFDISKIKGDNKECKLVDMIEIYPILLKEEDIAEQWAFIVNNYREAACQYKDSLKHPLPLHLAYKLEEYIYKK